MKIKNRLAIFNALTRILIILLLWLMLPVLVEKVVFKHINESLQEKKQKFIKHLDKREINDFITRKDSLETYASFSTFHSEFLQLSVLPGTTVMNKTVYITEPRIIEDEKDDYRILQYQFLYDHQPYLLEIGSTLSEIEDLIFAIRIFVLVLLFIILAMSFLMDSFYIEYLFKPFYRIIDTKIRRVNEPETFDHTPIITHSSDFNELDTVLNQMMDRITDLFKKEKQFIANVSHELLTPIALLKNRFENLLQNISLDDNAVDKIADSLKTLDMLKKIINNLLLISRIENQQYQANETIILRELLHGLHKELIDRIDEKELTFNINLQQNFSFIGNSTLIHILLHNLLINSIKFNNKKGSITINDGFMNANYFICVSDTGIGMDQDKVEQIFNRFTKMNSSREGQGLGLAIAQSIAYFHNIIIEVNSLPNSGTEFKLIFPVALENINKG